MTDITPGAEVNVELTPAAEIRAEVGAGAEVNVEVVPGAEVNVELVPAAEITVELVEGPTVEVELGGGAELHFLPDGVLSGYYDKDETDALLARKAEVTALAAKADRAELEQKADADHDHDGRYYTEAETDALLSLKVARAALLDLVYPVGAVYMSVNAASPETLFGGEWERIEDTFLLAAGGTYAAGSTGGEAEHTLTADESGQKALTITGGGHSHTVTTKYRKIFEAGTNRDGYYGAGTADGSNTTGATIAANTGGHTHWVSASAASSAHNNMPPYLAVYVWKRTA